MPLPSGGVRGRDRLGGASRTISSADLSSRRPLKAAARSSLSPVQPRYSISQTRRGSTQWTFFSVLAGTGLTKDGLAALLASSSPHSDPTDRLAAVEGM